MSKTAIVAGGTGLVGGHLVDLLRRSTMFDSVKVLVRDEQQVSMDGVQSLVVDYDHLDKYIAELKADIVFCCLGTTIEKAGTKEKFRKVDYHYPLKLAELAKSNDCKQFNIITSARSNPESWFFYYKTKGEAERSLSELQLKNLNIFRPSLLLGERKEKRTSELVIAKLSKVLKPLMVGKLKKYRAIQSEIVARAMLQVAHKVSTGKHIIESDMIQTLGEAYGNN